MEITEQDKRMVKALRHLLEKGSFNVLWREAAAFLSIQKWIIDLDKRMSEYQPKAKRNGRKSKRSI